MTNAKFRIKNGLEILEVADDSGTLTLLDGEINSDSTLTVFPKATSGTNTAGNNMIVQGGAGTGSGAGGDIKFNVAVASGGSGATGVNPLETKMKIASTGIVTMTDGTNATATNNGTLVVTGGVGISQNLFANAARFTGSTASSSTTTGALIVTGGTGISEDLYVGEDVYVGDNLSLTSDGAIINFGADAANPDVLLTHVADVGLQLSTSATSGANPVFEIYQDNVDANGGVLRFKKEAGEETGSDGTTADNDKLGVIQFFGDDAAGVQNNFGTIEGRIQDTSNYDELGRLMLRPRADSGGAGGIIIDGLTVEGLLNQKHHITVAVGGNRSGNATGYVESSAGGVISLFQAPTDNASKGAQYFAQNGTGSATEYTVLPAVNIGGGSTPRTFSATALAGGSAGNYTTNLLVNGTGYTEARISSVVGQIEGNRNPGLGSALVLETVDDENFNGIYFSRDQTNALSWIDDDISSDLATEGTWGAGWLTEGTDFSIGFHAAKYDSCAISAVGQTQLNPLVSGKSLFRITTAGNVGIKGAPSGTSSLQVYASGESNVGAVIGLESGSSPPASTTHRLYNDDGALMWGTTNLSASSASALNDLSDLTLSSPAEGAVLVNSGGTFIDALIAGTTNEVEVTNAAGAITIGLPSNVTLGGDLTLGGNDIKASDGTTALTLSGANVTVAGNLTVSGTTTAVNTTNMTVEDALIELGIVDGAAPSSDTSWDSGMLVNYYSSSAAKKAGFYWDSSTTAWSLSEVVTEGGSQVLTPTAGATEMRYLYDATNYYSIAVAADGATTLATVDSSAAAAHLTLDADGDIILDADGANITFKDNGTSILDFALGAANVTLDSVGDITLDVADGKDVILHEAGTIYASIGQGSVDIAVIAESTATTIDTFDCTTYQATKYLILVEDTTNTNYLSTEILVLGDENGGSTAVGYLTQYAVLYNDTELGEFTVTGSSNNINLQYTANDMSGASEHKVRVVATRIAAI